MGYWLIIEGFKYNLLNNRGVVLIQCASNMNTSILIRDTLKVNFTLAVRGRFDALRRRFVNVKWAFPRDAGGKVYFQ